VKEARAHHFATDALKEKAELMPDMQSKIRLLDEAIAIYYVRLPERERERVGLVLRAQDHTITVTGGA
jgi:hypothetical protein